MSVLCYQGTDCPPSDTCYCKAVLPVKRKKQLSGAQGCLLGQRRAGSGHPRAHRLLPKAQLWPAEALYPLPHCREQASMQLVPNTKASFGDSGASGPVETGNLEYQFLPERAHVGQDPTPQ